MRPSGHSSAKGPGPQTLGGRGGAGQTGAGPEQTARPPDPQQQVRGSCRASNLPEARLDSTTFTKLEDAVVVTF